MSSITSIFGGEFTPPKPRPGSDTPPEQQFRQAIDSAGYQVPSNIIPDGKIHRFSLDGKKSKTGWYVLHDGKIWAGAFGDWRDGCHQTWRQDMGRELSVAEQIEHSNRIKALKERIEAERKAMQESTAETMSIIWAGASDAADEHPYLARKGVKSYGLKVSGDGRLIVPMFNQSGELASAQYIPEHGEKKYHPGGEVAGCYFAIVGDNSRLYIAEGYATAASIHAATGCTAFVAFSAHQLPAVAKWVREQSPGAELTIVADNDKSGTGQKYAAEAANAAHAKVKIIPIVGMDANDYAQAGHDLAGFLRPAQQKEWLIHADDFCSQPAPIRWLVKGFIQREALHMIHGPSGGGKTFVVLDMMLNLATQQQEWRGQKTRPGKVAYLAGEGHHGLRARIAAWKQENAPGQSLNLWISRSGTDLNTGEGYQQAIESLRDIEPDVVVVDTLHRFLSGDENSAQDAKTMLDACGKIQAEFGCAVVLVHHTGVNEESQHRARGSSAWRGALDIEMSVIPSKESKPIELVCRKMKDGELFETRNFELKSTPINGWFDEDGEPVSSAILIDAEPVASKEGEKNKKNREVFLAAWNETGKEKCFNLPYVSAAGLQNYLVKTNGMTEATAKQLLKPSHKSGLIAQLLNSGCIEKVSDGWALKESGHDAALNILAKNA